MPNFKFSSRFSGVFCAVALVTCTVALTACAVTTASKAQPDVPTDKNSIRFRSAFQPFLSEAKVNAITYWCHNLVAELEREAIVIQADWAVRNGALYRAALAVRSELFEESITNQTDWSFRQYRDSRFTELTQQQYAMQSRVILSANNTMQRKNICRGLLADINTGRLDFGSDDQEVKKFLIDKAASLEKQKNCAFACSPSNNSKSQSR